MPGCLSVPVGALADSQMKTRRQLKALESHGVKPALLFLENYKHGVGSMPASAHNHNNRYPVEAGPLTSAIRALKTPNSAKCTAKQVATQGGTPINTEKRRRGRPRKNSPPRNSVGRCGRVTGPSSVRYTFPVPDPPSSRNRSKAEDRSTRQNVKTGRCSQKQSVPPLSFGESAKTVRQSRKRSAPASSRSDHAMIVDCSPKRSPPSLSANSVEYQPIFFTLHKSLFYFFLKEEERSAVPLPPSVSSAFSSGGRNRHDAPPIALIQRKRHLVELFDSILPTDICDGRMSFEEIMNRIRRFVADLVVAASQPEIHGGLNIDYNYQHSAEPSRALLPTDQLGIENLLPPVRSPYNLPYQPQNSSDSGRRPLSNVRMISEGREENYGLGAFQDANIRALLPNTPVYSAARLRNLVHSSGMAMTERENTEIVPVEKLDPHQFQLLQDEGFRLVTLNLPEDNTSLTNMQRMALADMRNVNENTPEKKPKSITY
ncbi:hypothetical protein Aduo_008040 [Ancylostoma duodenale]